MAVNATDSYFARLLKKLPIIGRGVEAVQNYYFNQGLKGAPMGTLPKLQQAISQVPARPVDFTPLTGQIKNPLIRVPATLGGTVLSEMVNVPTRLVHYGSRLGQADTPTELIGSASGVAGALADIPLTQGAFGLGKALAKNVPKKTVSELLRTAAKGGLKTGGVLGGLYGLEEGIDAKDLKSQAVSGLRGAGVGAAAGAFFGAGLAGLGIGGKALLDFGKWLMDANYSPSKGAMRGGVELASEMTGIDKIIKNRQVKGEVDIPFTRAELEAEFRSAKTFDQKKLGQALKHAEKTLGADKLAELAYKNTTGTGLNYKDFWSSVKAALKKKPPAGQKEDYWEGLLTEIDGWVSRADKPPSTSPKPLRQVIDEEVIKKTVAGLAETGTDSGPFAKKPLPQKTDPLTALRASVFQRPKDRSGVAKVFANTEAALTNIGRRLQKSLAKKGIGNDDFVARFEAGNHRGIEEEAALIKEVNKVLRAASPEENLDRIENYIHRFKKESGLSLREVFPSTYFDVVDEALGYKKYRTNKMVDYERDLPTILRQLGKEVLLDRYQDFFEAEALGQSVERVRAKRGFAKELVQNIEADKVLGKDYSLAKLARKVVLAEPGPKSRLKTVKGTVNLFPFLFDTNVENLKRGGVWEHFVPLRLARAKANALYNEVLAPITSTGSRLRKALEQAGFRNGQGIVDYIKEQKFSQEERAGFLQTLLYKKVKGEALDGVINFLGTHRFENNNLQQVAEWVVARELAVDVVPKTLVNKAMRNLRMTYYRGALGFNIRAALNNILETKRAFAVGKATDFPEAIAQGLNKKTRSALIEKYGQGLSVVQEELNNRSTYKKATSLLERLDPYLFHLFQESENFKDATLLYVLEKDGLRKGLSGEGLTRFVIEGFDKFAHKYGSWGTVGMFRHDLVKTAGQFTQYPLKEAGLIAKQTKKSLRGIGSLLRGDKMTDKEAEGIRYVLKLAGANTALVTLLGSLYGATFEEVWGAMPFEPSGEGVKVSASPAFALVNNLAYAYADYKKNQEEGAETALSNNILQNLGKSGALFVPGGNQLLLKTGRGIHDILRGYNPSSSGQVRFLGAESPAEAFKTAVMGPFSTAHSREYFDKNRRPLGANQTEDFRLLWQAGDKEAAREYYNEIMASREKERAMQKTLLALEKGRAVSETSDFEVHAERKRSILEMLGLTKSAQATKEALNEFETGSTPYTKREIDGVVNEQRALTIQDIVAKKQAQSDKDALIKKVMDIRGPFKALPDEVKSRYLAGKGITQADVDGFMWRELSRSTPKDRADYITSNNLTDFVELYKNEVLTLEVAKELQRKGYIPSATELMDKLKLTDPYYLEEYNKKITKKLIDEVLKSNQRTRKAILQQNLTSMKKLLGVKRKKRTPLPYDLNYAASLRKRL